MIPSPVFVLISSSRAVETLAQRLRSHARTVAVNDPVEAAKALRAESRCAALWIDGRFPEDAILALFDEHPRLRDTPSVWTSPRRPACDLDAIGCRWLPRNAPRAEVRYFLGHALALEVTRRPLVARAVEALARERELTERQMELSAIATLPLRRDELLAGMGVSQNTLKTRIRQLLRVHQVDSLDALGKHVLSVAVDLASQPPPRTSAPSVPPPPPQGTLPVARHSPLSVHA